MSGMAFSSGPKVSARGFTVRGPVDGVEVSLQKVNSTEFIARMAIGDQELAFAIGDRVSIEPEVGKSALVLWIDRACFEIDPRDAAKLSQWMDTVTADAVVTA